MKLQTITTLELSNICNLSCKYCINRLIPSVSCRTPGIMTDNAFVRSCDLIQKLCDKGTQREIFLNGNGESLLDSKIIERIGIIREIMGKDRQIGLSTNGLLIDENMTRKLSASGLSRLDISCHSPYHTRRAAHLLTRVGMQGIVSFGAILQSHNWAGQLEPENTIDCKLNNICDPLIEGRGYILCEGNITPCCYDYRNLGVFGTVFAIDKALDAEVRAYQLCETCHQRIPEYLLKENNMMQVKRS